MNRKHLKYLLVLFAFCVFISIVVEQSMLRSTPVYLLNKYKELINDKVLMDSIGGFSDFEYSHESIYRNDYDSILYEILIFGNKGKLVFTAIGIEKYNSEEEISKEEFSIDYY